MITFIISWVSLHHAIVGMILHMGDLKHGGFKMLVKKAVTMGMEWGGVSAVYTVSGNLD